ncbi:bifunctional adenosylcobinamide kinase/adenosylcobinamide-phosphate guanylyltransferase [Solwaraspora sp. WMMD1047]|uniref:bifunctional adenosylcobinamide kinase/adenosylcobinamide-phosphate guanylyltransferase n=1 Tax=Solwaraspora sp. WMMD1047 TaxID=3016102 RepID=UPI0024160FAD|nr:bifunctional adenosylcobinamide kinase/adenosylcobinamide-phosphate guanylyltransferase [Solwaraspora sp. WMMD1047]MDG4832285.1 bifunctional adenosylcobinamide kinase/adenosylcobinamide-phosphate guanylyltransferase [Solwaraspora sp. WMMD1047]
MSLHGWNTILVLGGIRSGKSEFAEELVGDAGNVRYVATAAAPGADDPEWIARIETHRQRRPENWTIEETSADPARLIEVISAAGPADTLLVDDLGGWVTVLLDPAHQPADDVATIAELAAAVAACAARLVLVSSEVGLSMVPLTPVGRAFADALGSANRALADACDAVVLVVAGQPAWLKPTQPAQAAQAGQVAPPAQPVEEAPATPAPVEPRPAVLTPSVPPAEPSSQAPAASEISTPAAPDAGWAAPTMSLPVVATGLVIQPAMELPMPAEAAGADALDRLTTLDLPGAGLGNLAEVVSFAAATQGTPAPEPWRSVRVMLLHGDHSGGAAAGTVPGESTRRADLARSGEGPLARLAAEAGATLQVIDAPTAAPIEAGPALVDTAIDAALRFGWQLAEDAVEAGVRVIVLGACGAGSETASAAVLAATAGAEPAAVLARVLAPGGLVDDTAWMVRCATVRDALHRTRRGTRTAKEVLAELGGGDIAIATGILLGATARRTPVLLDGPVGVAAALISRDLAGQARHWCLLADHGGHPTVRHAADVLGLTPLFDLRLDLGEGATALATLPLLRSALALAATLPVHPALAPTTEPESDGWQPEPADDEPAGPTDARPDDNRADVDRADVDRADKNRADDSEFIEPEPAGPGPAAADRPEATGEAAGNGGRAASDVPAGGTTAPHGA